MTFGEALEHIKKGKFVSRKGWNGKGMFLFMGFPRVVIPAKQGFEKYKTVDASDYFGCSYSGPTLCMKTAQDTIVIGWLASQTDMVSNDWIKENPPAKPE